MKLLVLLLHFSPFFIFPGWFQFMTTYVQPVGLSKGCSCVSVELHTLCMSLYSMYKFLMFLCIREERSYSIFILIFAAVHLLIFLYFSYPSLLLLKDLLSWRTSASLMPSFITFDRLINSAPTFKAASIPRCLCNFFR